ncbi:MAG TPA: hypothetical protein PKA64_07195 [Myxococcota bacterium]|nr:hypothetical protein [Myxococcota bacterium]
MRRLLKGETPEGPFERPRARGGPLHTLAEMDQTLQAELALSQLRTNDWPDFDVRGDHFDQLDKDRARKELHREQAGRCAFCERRIAPRRPADATTPDASATRIAHLIPIGGRPPRGVRGRPDLALTWSNLFGSCDTSAERGRRHCDDAQGDRPPPVDAPSPADADYAAWLEIQEDDGRFVPAPDAPPWVAPVLALWNLNDDRLREARFYVIIGVEEELAEQADPIGWLRDRLEAVTAWDTDQPHPSAQRRWIEARLSRSDIG